VPRDPSRSKAASATSAGGFRLYGASRCAIFVSIWITRTASARAFWHSSAGAIPRAASRWIKAADSLALPRAIVKNSSGPRRLTLVLSHRKIEKVFDPVFPPDKHAAEVIDWLRHHPARRT
jgi:hypothetical protein